MSWMTGFRFPEEAEISSHRHRIQTVVGPTQPLANPYRVLLPRGQSGQGVP